MNPLATLKRSATVSTGTVLLLMASAQAPGPQLMASDCHAWNLSLDHIAGDDPSEVDWRMLSGLNYRTGEVSDALKAVDGELVKVPGFTVPLEDWATTATEFLLVPYVGACVHTPPPPPNQLVYVEMEGGKRATLDGWNPVWLEGTLHIEDVESVYGETGFRIVGTKLYPYTY